MTNNQRRLGVLIGAIAMGTSIGAHAGGKLDPMLIENRTGLKGKWDQKQLVFKVSYPRSDLDVTIKGMKATPPVGLTAWAAFTSMDQGAMVMGDLVLTEDQVNPVMSVALEGFTPAQQVVEVRSNVPLTRDVELKVGSLAETVNVSADALLETTAAGSHVDIGATLIDQMPTATPSKQLSAMLLSAPGFIPSQNGRVHVRGSHGQIQYVVDNVTELLIRGKYLDGSAATTFLDEVRIAAREPRTP